MTDSWHPKWGYVKESRQGDVVLYQLNGKLYTFTSLEPDYTWDDYWHYGVNWWAVMMEEEEDDQS